MFDQTLGWDFVATNVDSAAQIFLYFPQVLQTGLGITCEFNLQKNPRFDVADESRTYIADQTKTFALQVWEPSTYTSTNDVDQLRTLFIGYIPDENVTALAQAIKAKTSSLYEETTGIPNELAQRIDASFSVTSVSDPIGSSTSSDASTSSSSSDNSKRDAIIGVCSALGGIALCIFGFLIYRNFKRRQEAAHHRLAEPTFDATPAPGQDFDRDSIGGQRRRSFYFAEDSIRGTGAPQQPQTQQQQQDETYMHTVTPQQGMRERRAIIPGQISAPILRDNTMNW